MEGFIPTGGAGGTAKIQEASGNAGVADASVTATFPVPATSGNTVIAMMSWRGTSGTPFSDPSGWTVIGDIQGPAFDGGRSRLYYRTVPGGGLTGLTIGNSAIKKSLYIAEWPPLTFLSDVELDSQGADDTMTTAALTPTGGVPAVLIAAFNQSSRNPVIAIQSPFSEDYDRDVDASGPSVVLGHRIVSLTSGSYTAQANSSQVDGYGAYLGAFQAAAGGITWVIAPDTVDVDDGTSDDVTAVAIAATGGAFWRGTSDHASTGQFRAVLGFDTLGPVTVLVQAGDASDWSDAATVLTVDFDASGSFGADEIDVVFDGEAHTYWRLVLDSTADDMRIYEVTFGETIIPTPQPAAKAILELYMHDEDASRWGIATWATGPATGTEGIWSAAGWQDVTPEGVNAHIIWGSRRPSRGILADQNAASWNVQTYDPDRILDPGNFDSPFYPQLVAGVPIRISHDSMVIRTGYVDEFHYKHKEPFFQGQMLCTDTWSLLNQAQVPADSILGNTLIERIQDAINAAGIAVGGIPLPPGGPSGPTIADWVEGAAEDDPTSVGDHIRNATGEVLWVPYIMADAGLGLRPWGAPLDRGREITAANLEDLESVSSEDGLYSVVSVMPDPAGTPIIRKATPLPRYGERVWERREPTVDPEGYAAAILAERPWPGVQYVPGAIHCFTAADVQYFGSLEIMERVTVTVAGAVSVQGRILGGELFVEHRAHDTKGAKWIFNFAIATDGATAIGLTTLVADGTGDTLVDDMTETDYLEAD